VSYLNKNCSFNLAIIIPNINGGYLLVPGTPPFSRLK